MVLRRAPQPIVARGAAAARGKPAQSGRQLNMANAADSGNKYRRRGILIANKRALLYN